MEIFERTKLWKATLAARENDDSVEARQKLRQNYIDLRLRVGEVLKQIARDVPDLTVHDLTHVDSLWEISDLLLGSAISNFTPAEAFLLGGAFLLHDAGLAVVSFKGGFPSFRAPRNGKMAWSPLCLERKSLYLRIL